MPAADARLFLAVPPGLRERRALAAARDALPRGPWILDPVADADFHLTVHFLGATPLRLVDDLRRELGAVCHARRRFDLRLGRVRAFPDAGDPRVVCIGIEDPGGRFEELRAATGRVLRAYGIPGTGREVEPHVTLARVERPDPGRSPGAPLAAAPGAGGREGFGVEALALMRSRPEAEGPPRYEALAVLPLS